MKKKKLKSLSLNKFKVAKIDNTSMFKGGNDDESDDTGCRSADLTRCNTQFIRICTNQQKRTRYCLTGDLC